MARCNNNLSSEVHKIIQSPYPVSLKPLHNVLLNCQEQRSDILHQWAYASPAEVPLLAQAVAQNPSSASYLLDLILQLSSLRLWRIAFLHSSPTILNEYLEQATNGNPLSIYTKICLEFLAEQLPDQMGLPASTQTFLWRIFNYAANHPSVESMEPVYFLLNGACHSLIETLPKADVQRMQDHLTSVIRSATGMEEQLLTLFCLAILSLIGPSLGGTGFHKFFTGERASRTLQLIVLQVIFGCRTDAPHNSKSLKTVSLARQIVHAIEPEARQHWSQSNQALLKKLLQKASVDNLPWQLQIEAIQALTFCSGLVSNVELLPTAASANFRRIFLVTCQTLDINQNIDQALSPSISFFLPSYDVESWQTLLLALAEASMRMSSSNLSHRKPFLKILDTLNECCKKDTAARHHAINAIKSVELQEKLRLHLRPTADCVSVTARAFYGFLIDALLVETTDRLDLDRELASRLIQRLSASNGTCESSLSVLSPSCKTLRVQDGQLENSVEVSQDWRTKLASDLGMYGEIHYQRVIELVGLVCKDFEDRCDLIEKPLKAEQMRTAELENENEALKYQAHELKLNAEELERVIRATEQATLKAQEDDFAKVTELQRRIEHLEAELIHAQSESEKSLRTLRGDFECQRLQFEVRVACEVEKSDDQVATIQSLKERLCENESLLEQKKSELSLTLKSKEEEIQGLHVTVQSVEVQAAKKDKELANFAENEARLNCQLEEKLIELEAKSMEIEDFKTLEKGHADSLANERAQAELKIAKLTSEHDRQRQDLERRVLECKGEMEQAKRCFDKSHAAQNKKMKDLERKIHGYEGQLQQKDRHLHDAQRLRQRLLVAMGLNEDPHFTAQNIDNTERLTMNATSLEDQQRELANLTPVQVSSSNVGNPFSGSSSVASELGLESRSSNAGLDESQGLDLTSNFHLSPQAKTLSCKKSSVLSTMSAGAVNNRQRKKIRPLSESHEAAKWVKDSIEDVKPLNKRASLNEAGQSASHQLMDVEVPSEAVGQRTWTGSLDGSTMEL